VDDVFLSHGPFDIRAAIDQRLSRGVAGERELSALLVELTSDGRGPVASWLIAAALGNAEGDAGPAALRAALHAPGASSGVRCAALLSLRKRCGAEATPDLIEFLGARAPEVVLSAVAGVAAVADERARTPVVAMLTKRLAREPSHRYRDRWVVTIELGLVFLARVGGTHDREWRRLVQSIRNRWSRIGDHSDGELPEFIRDCWPDCADASVPIEAVGSPQIPELRPWLDQYRASDDALIFSV
jgi:hypothetical protein